MLDCWLQKLLQKKVSLFEGLRGALKHTETLMGVSN